jgi:hypothetical protein
MKTIPGRFQDEYRTIKDEFVPLRQCRITGKLKTNKDGSSMIQGRFACRLRNENRRIVANSLVIVRNETRLHSFLFVLW